MESNRLWLVMMGENNKKRPHLRTYLLIFIRSMGKFPQFNLQPVNQVKNKHTGFVAETH